MTIEVTIQRALSVERLKHYSADQTQNRYAEPKHRNHDRSKAQHTAAHSRGCRHNQSDSAKQSSDELGQ